jgi:hypothetical protein
MTYLKLLTTTLWNIHFFGVNFVTRFTTFLSSIYFYAFIEICNLFFKVIPLQNKRIEIFNYGNSY